MNNVPTVDEVMDGLDKRLWADGGYLKREMREYLAEIRAAWEKAQKERCAEIYRDGAEQVGNFWNEDLRRAILGAETEEANDV